MATKTGAPTTVRLMEDAVFKLASDKDIVFRRLEWGDFDKGFLDVLS